MKEIDAAVTNIMINCLNLTDRTLRPNERMIEADHFFKWILEKKVWGIIQHEEKWTKEAQNQGQATSTAYNPFTTPTQSAPSTEAGRSKYLDDLKKEFNKGKKHE